MSRLLRIAPLLLIATAVQAPSAAQDLSRMLGDMNRALQQFGGTVEGPRRRDPYYDRGPPAYHERPGYEQPRYDQPRIYAPPQPRHGSSQGSELRPQQVYELQTLLNQAGFGAGEPDGRYGAGTRQAIRAFQRSESLEPDGRATPTLLALARTRAEQRREPVGPPRVDPTPGLEPPRASPPAPQPVVPAATRPSEDPVPPAPAPRFQSAGDPPEKDSKAFAPEPTPAERLRRAAEQGSREAQLQLAMAYYNGDGIPRHPGRAAMWFANAANQGSVEANFYLAGMLAGGDGVAPDPGGAVTLYRKAAERGHTGAQFNLGTMYARGEGVVQNDQEAARWFRAAAQSGMKEAQYALGYQHYEGRGVPVDYAEAAAWFRKAAEQQHAGSAAYLAHMYYAGQGVTANHPEAVRWARLAAQLGIADAGSTAALACSDLNTLNGRPGAPELKREKGWDSSNEALCSGGG